MNRGNGVESDDSVPTTPFGPVEGMIGGIQESVPVTYTFLQGCSYADTNGDSKGLPFPVKRLLFNFLSDFFRDSYGH